MDAYAQMEIRLQRLMEDKAALIREFRQETSAGVKQLIHEDIAATNDAIERLTAKMEAYATNGKE